MDKPWYKSVTVWAAAAWAALGSLEYSGAVPTGASQTLSDLVQKVIEAAAIFGFRRAMK